MSHNIPLKESTLVCFDFETTGLDIENDRIIEIGIAIFRDNKIIDSFETLIDPQMSIPKASEEIHHINDSMVQGKPSIETVLPKLLSFIKDYPIMGHGIDFDIRMLCAEAKRFHIPHSVQSNVTIDTLRLARYYGKAPVNSLQALRQHFNVDEETAHRAMGDVIVNIEVFKHLSQPFKTLKELLETLSHPIELKVMPLGKHKGRPFKEIPLNYLQWAVKKDFDLDLKHSIRRAIKRHQRSGSFDLSTNPFKNI